MELEVRVGGLRIGRIVLSILITLYLSACATQLNVLSEEELQAKADDRLSSLYKNQTAVDKPITLYEAMARAILYNLDTKVEQRRMLLSQQELKAKRYDMLPQLVGNGSWAERNNHRSSRSVGVTEINGQETLGAERFVTRPLHLNKHLALTLN